MHYCWCGAIECISLFVRQRQMIISRAISHSSFPFKLFVAPFSKFKKIQLMFYTNKYLLNCTFELQ